MTLYDESLHIPDSWQHGYRRLRARNRAASTVAAVLWFITALAMLAMLVLHVRDRNVRWGTAAAFGFAAFVLQLLAALNRLALGRFDYPTEDRYVTFVLWQLILSVLLALAQAGLIFLLTAAAEPLYRERYPNKLALACIFTRRGIGTRSFFKQVLLGITLTFFFSAFQVVFYLVASRFGAWAPLDVPYSNMLNTAFPWAVVLLAGFHPAVSEEFVSRMFSIPFLSKVLGRTRLGGRTGVWVAVILASFIWGFAHSDYPNQPFYIRGLEVGSAGLLIGFVMLRWGILAALVWHYTVDAFYTAYLLVRSGSTYFEISGWIAAGLMLVPLVVSLLLYVRRGGFEPEAGLRNADQPGPRSAPPPAAAPAELVAPPETVPRRRLVWAAGVAAAFLLLYAIPAQEPGDRTAFRHGRERIVESARHHARRLGVEPDSFRMAAAVVSRFDRDVGRYVLEHSDIATLNELYAGPLRTPVWRVRFFRAEEREELVVDLPVDAEPLAPAARGSPRPLVPLWAFRHVMPDSAAGDTLAPAAALQLAEEFLGANGVEPAVLVLQESSTQKRPARVDHAFEWEGPDATPAESRLRYSVVVRGGHVAGLRAYLHLPESWLRDQHEQPLLQHMAWLFSHALLGVGILVVALLFIGQVRQHRFPWLSSLRWGALAGSFPVVFVALRWSSDVLMDHSTTTPEALFGIEVGASVLVQFLAQGVQAAVLIGTLFAIRPRTRWLLSGGFDPVHVRQAVVLALLGVALLAGVQRAAAHITEAASTHARVTDLLRIEAAASSVPWLDAYVELLGHALRLLPLLAITAWLGRHALGVRRTAVLVSIGLVFFAADDARTPGQFGLALGLDALRVGAVLLLVSLVCRGNDLAYVLTFLAAGGLSTAVEWIRQPAPDLRASGWILALLVVVTLWLIARAATRRSRTSPQAGATASLAGSF
ncbi:MAG: type II CAAX prenyl endopeptidase Rce1 family protein [Candidatus Krumholzibacteriia bacterium]